MGDMNSERLQGGRQSAHRAKRRPMKSTSFKEYPDYEVLAVRVFLVGSTKREDQAEWLFVILNTLLRIAR